MCTLTKVIEFKCLECCAPIDELVDDDAVSSYFIVCPACGNKMVVECDERYIEQIDVKAYQLVLAPYKEQSH